MCQVRPECLGPATAVRALTDLCDGLEGDLRWGLVERLGRTPEVGRRMGQSGPTQLGRHAAQGTPWWWL